MDGGYVFAGQSNHTLTVDVTIIKMRSDGTIEWQKNFGGPGIDFANSIIQTIDGGYLFAGETDSMISEGVYFHAKGDAWLVKLDSAGRMLWQQCYGGTNWDRANCVIQTQDGNYLFTGNTTSNDGDVKGDHTNAQDPSRGPTQDAWIVKVNPRGDLLWQKCLGGGLRDWGSSILEGPDGSLVFAGYSESTDGDLVGNSGILGMWVLKLRDTAITWRKFLYYSSGGDEIHSVCRLLDGSYVVTGTMIDNDTMGADAITRSSDIWTVKLDSSGSLLWQRCLGGSGNEASFCVAATSDSGCVIIGNTASEDDDLAARVHAPNDAGDIWVIKLSQKGATQWSQWYGGSAQDFGFTIVPCTDGGFAFAGITVSSDGDVKSNTTKSWNSWIVKLKGDRASVLSKDTMAFPLSISPNPSFNELSVFYATTDQSRTQFVIYDLLGDPELQTNDENTSIGERQMKINVSKLPEGIYMLKVQSGNQIATKNFTIMR